jgi:hypothetical protein
MPASQLPDFNSRVASPRRLKNEAKRIRKTQPELSHYGALNEAARTRGGSNYKTSQKAWLAQSTSHVIRLTADWVDRSSYGRIHALVPLSEPWPNFLTLSERRCIYTLGKFRIANKGRTHLRAMRNLGSLHACVLELSKAARQLVFVDVMRVRPAWQSSTLLSFRGDPHKVLTERFPSQDHETLWCDPTNDLHFILNEPYNLNEEKQSQYLASKDMVVHTAHDWPIHNPEGTLSQLIAPAWRQKDLSVLCERSTSLPQRFNQISFIDDENRPLAIFKT